MIGIFGKYITKLILETFILKNGKTVAKNAVFAFD